jgi:hypothetical protein
MPDRISPPSWTEWTRSPSERTPSRKAFDDLLGELRRDGLVEARASLFVQLARYSYLHVKNAVVDVDAFLKGIPDSMLSQIPPTARPGEVDAVLRILQAAGLVTAQAETDGRLTEIVLTERQGAGDVARGQVSHTVLTHLRDIFTKWDPASLVLKPSSFPTPGSVAKATGVDRAHLTPGDGVTVLQDRPESNEANNAPFLQETVDEGRGALIVLQFWALPDPKGESSGGAEPELNLIIPGDMPLASLVRDYAIPVLGSFFLHGETGGLAAEIQAKYASYMTKYRERFTSSAVTGDRIDRVFTTADPEGEGFANAVYVMTQVLRAAQRQQSRPNPVVYQAARVAYAHAMALRVKKRRTEKEAASRQQDASLLVNRLKDSGRPLSLDELKRTPDVTKNKEIGSKYPSVIELLPLTSPREGARPVIFELANTFVHRENLLRAFLELREQESIEQRDKLAQQWAAGGIPPIEEIFLTDRDVSIEFLKAFEQIHQERVLSTGLPDFIKDYVPENRALSSLEGWLWPEGHRGGITPMEVVTRGLDPILYEDKEHLKRRSIASVLRLQAAYPAIVKNAWNIVFMEEGLFSFILRRIAAFFGGGGGSKKVKEKVAKAGGAGGGAPDTSRSGRSGGGKGEDAVPDARALKAADLKKLKELAPILNDRAAASADREKLVAQWNLKLDGEAARRTRQTVDAEVARLVMKLSLDQMGEENSAKVAIFLVEKSAALGQITSSRAFHRYLYLTALLRRADLLAK